MVSKIKQRKAAQKALQARALEIVEQQEAAASMVTTEGSVPVQRREDGGAAAATPSATMSTRNHTGLPDNVKSGIESLSGYSMIDVNVHYNSSKPAQLQALAYTQGSDIHVGPGQEQHIPHEAWHVVQQKQGRVRPTMQMKGTNINDNDALEKEADVMGARAVQMKSSAESVSIGSGGTHYGGVTQLRNNTEIDYQQGTLNWAYTAGSAATVPGYAGPPLVPAVPVGATQPVGVHTTAFLDPEDPERGENARSYAEGGIYLDYTYAPQNRGHRLTQGHLLNANMGGKARSYNLFPITATMNDAHSAVVEDTVKHMLITVKRNRVNEYAAAVRQAAITAAGPILQTAADTAGANAAITALQTSGLLAGFINHAQVATSFNDLLVRLGQLPQNTGQVGINAAHAARNAQLNAVGNPAAAAEQTRRLTPQQIIADSSLTAAPLAPGNVAAATTAGVNAGASATRGAAQVTAARNAQQAYNTTITAGYSPAVAGVAASHQPVGPAGTRAANSDDIAAAASSAPATVGTSLWDNTRVFYEVKVESPGLNGGVFSPATIHQEKFICTAYTTANDGTTRRGDGTGFNRIEIMDRSQVFNAELESLGFGANNYLVGSFAIDPTALGVVATGAGTPGAPSQHNIFDNTGAVTGHATLFNHSP
ncbi:MAG: DUF4157 domain-containing protein [Gammaproteobacteria bacterium]|nr:DUF4157 domain-containing protein [Gammaproteobacteria bacterium]